MIRREVKISVIISVYNAEEYLGLALKSILNQSFTDFELILVNDASTDNSLQIIQSFSDSRIRVINNQSNLGLALSLNKALEEAGGKYIARMDADDLSHPQRLGKQYQFMESHPEIMLSGTGVIYIDKDGLELGRAVNPETLGEVKKFLFSGRTPCFHPTWIFKKELLGEIGAYRNLPSSQDYDLLARALYRGFRISNLTEPLLSYRIHPQRIGQERNLTQIKLGRYIRSAYREGFLFEESKFQTAALTRIFKVPFILKSLHKASMPFFNKGVILRRKGNPVFMLLLLLAAVISPYQMYHILNYFLGNIPDEKEGEKR